MQKKRIIKIISIVLILVLICVTITYVKSGNKEVIATTKEFNSENLQDNEHMHVEVDSSGDKVPVPNGYVGSKATGENEIDTGYVIYEGTEEVNDSNVEEAQKTRNQYVWIPVPDASTMYGTDKNGKKWGKLYEFTMDTGDSIDLVTGAKANNWKESDDGIIQIINKNMYREPDISIDLDIDSNLKQENLRDLNAIKLLNQLEQEFNDMVESIEKYKGFFIGRYEMGNLSKEKAVIQKGNSDINYQTWYTMYEKCKMLSTNNKNISTGVIWGCQWDRTLMWLIESKSKSKEAICKDSSNWGNYLNAEFEYTSSNGSKVVKKSGTSKIIPTGSSEYTKTNNIYDLAGNVWDSTMRSYWKNSRTNSGGSCGFLGSEYPVTRKNNANPISSVNAYRMSCNVIHKIGKIVYYVHM